MMKLRIMTAFAVGAMLTAGIVTEASAQGPGRPGPGRPMTGPQGGFRRMAGGPPVSFLIRRPDVQKDLKLSAAQIARIGKLAPPSFGRPGAGGPPDFAEFEKQRIKMDADANAILTAPQRKRVKEIGLQLSGPFAVLQPDVQKALGITASQQKQITDALPRFGGRPGGPGRPGGGPGRPGGPGGPGRPGGPGAPGGPPGGPGSRKELEAKVDKVLTAKQRAQLKAMRGKPFTPTSRR